MDPLELFNNERNERIDNYKKDIKFNDLSSIWLEHSMKEKYVYNFDWLGRPIIQYPQDIIAVQEIIWKTKPDIIIETGIAHGGSLILSASMLAMLDYCEALKAGGSLDVKKSKRKVIGVDIDIRDHNRQAIQSHPMAHKIDMVEGSSISEEIIKQVKSKINDGAKVMVCLDSMHTHDHVIKELELYSPLVTSGCYLIVFDTFVQNMPNGFFEDRPWDVSNNPMTAVHEWIEKTPDFEIDHKLATKLQVTVAPDGFLLKK